MAGEGVGRDHAADGKAAPHPLADRHHVGFDAIVIDAPHRAGPSEARQHLVRDEERAMIFRNGLDRAQEPRRRNDVARRSLDWLDDDRGDLARRLVADHIAKIFRARDAALGIAKLQGTTIAVGVGREILAGQEWAEVMLELAAQEPEHAAGLAVKGTPEPEDLVLARRRLREAQRCLDGFRAAGKELDARQALGRDRCQQLEEPRACLRREAAERQALDLSLERLDVVRVAMPHAPDPDTRDEIDVLVAVLVDERAAFPAGDGETGIEREGLQARRHVALLSRDDLTRAWSHLATRGHRVAPVNRSTRCSAIRSAASSR